MRFDLADLRLLLAVLESGSITHGAAAVNLSLPAASERIKDMERSAGVELMRRGRRGVTATSAGTAAADHARKILFQASALRAELAEHAHGVRACIRLVANSAAIAEHLPGRLGPWLAAHPGIDIDLAEQSSLKGARAVAGNLAEIGIVSDAVDTDALIVRLFAVDRLVVVSAPDHAFGRAGQLAFIQTLEERHISIAGALHDHLGEHALRLGYRFEPRLKLRTFESLCLLAAQSAGVAVVPETVALRVRRSQDLSMTHLSDAWATRRLLICHNAQTKLYATAQDLFERLADNGERLEAS